MITRFIARMLVNSLAIALAAYFIPGFNFPLNDWKTLLVAGLVLAVFNAFLKPLIKLISAPFIILTLGLFTLIINIALLWLLTQFVSEITIADFWAYFWGTLVISLVNFISSPFLKKKGESKT